jgi:hypothetical protein
LFQSRFIVNEVKNYFWYRSGRRGRASESPGGGAPAAAPRPAGRRDRYNRTRPGAGKYSWPRTPRAW